MTAFGPLGSWPLECWVNGCANGRVDDVYCRTHAWQQLPATPAGARAPRRAHGELQRDLLKLLRSTDRPMRSAEVAHLQRMDPSLASRTLGTLVEKGLARKLGLGTYAAVTS